MYMTKSKTSAVRGVCSHAHKLPRHLSGEQTPDKAEKISFVIYIGIVDKIIKKVIG